MYTGLFKRIIPFFLTFAVGLFVASFFVTLVTPNFNFRRGSGKYREMQRVRSENQELKRTNFELRKENDELRRNARETFTVTAGEFSDLEPSAPPPSPPTRAPRHPKFVK